MNRTHCRVGHVFQGRYKAILVEKDSYLLELSRYVVLNPVRAGMVADVGEWLWSSYPMMIGKKPAPPWLEVDWLLGQFGRSRDQARHRYRDFVRAGVGLPSIWDAVRDQVFLGSEAFAERLKQSLPLERNLREVPRIQRRPLAKPLEYYLRLPDRRQAMALAYRSGGYTMQQILMPSAYTMPPSAARYAPLSGRYKPMRLCWIARPDPDFSAESVHLIGHSKGGLDARAFINLVQRAQIPVQVGAMSGQALHARLEIPSLATHGTPHQGTAVADSIAANVSLLAPVAHLVFSDLCALTTYGMERFNQRFPVPPGLRLLAIGADADQDGDGVMSDDEAGGNQVSNPVANMWYQINRNTKSIVVEHEWIYVPNLLSTIPIPYPVTTPTTSPQPNDGLVTVVSATHLDGAMPHVMEDAANHGTILAEKPQRIAIQAGINGALQWGQK